MHEKVIIFDFGSQYTQLIGRRVREHNVFSEIVPFYAKPKIGPEVKAVILSGSPFSVMQKDFADLDLSGIVGKVPVLGICYGAQLYAKKSGGHVEKTEKREYGQAFLTVVEDDPLFKGMGENERVWMSHGDSILDLPKDFKLLARTNDIPVAVYKKITGTGKDFYGLQFHPEVTHTTHGSQLIKNFLDEVAGCSFDWTPGAFIRDTIADLREKIGKEHVLMGLSGGVDSTVGAVILNRAIGDQLHCVFVDNGLLRKDEFEQVLNDYKNLDLNITGVRANDHFYDALKGLENPEDKRKAIGRSFIEVFEKHAKGYPDIKWLGQGTIYPDVIESVSVHGPSVTIKSHHNVGGLPDKLNLKIVEPLRMLFKDEVRRMGKELEISADLLGRHPFPGPGLGIRILGEVTEEKVLLLQKADHIYINKLREYDLYDKVWQACTILLPVQSVGVMGDERTYEKAIVLRAVNSMDGMTAVWSDFPYEFLSDVSSTIINQVKGINRVVYDISTKPPATIEWE